MDTTSLGINQGSEELFIGWIIVIIGLIVIFFLSKMNKKEKKSTDVDLPPTQKLLNSNDNKTVILTTNSNGKSSSDNQPQTIATKTGINENSSGEQIIPQPIKPIDIIAPPIIIKPEPKPSKPKHIGYNPTNIFAQTEPLNYPYVIMPSRPECVIKFPQKGRTGRKGYKEESFLQFIQKYFRDTFKIYDDRYVLAKTNRYEPDFSLLNEKEGINIFLDIEIDEPYEGINDVNNRKATHFQYADTWKSHATLTLLAKQDCPLWLQYD